MALLVAFALSVSWHRHLNPSQEGLDGIQMKINAGSEGVPQKNFQKMDSIQLDGRFGGITKVSREEILCNEP
jgi:hypothetical protein